MPKYYTPKSAIRFANQDAAAFKKLAMTVEVCVQVASDHGHRWAAYSGVIRFRLRDWLRYTTIWLYGDTVDTDMQDFVQLSISDASSSTYIENQHVESVLNPGTIYLTGSNFKSGVSGTLVYIADQLASSTFVSRDVIEVHTTGWFDEQENVPTKVVRSDLHSSTIYSGISFEERPAVQGMDLTGTYIDGGVPLNIVGDYFKANSDIRFTSGTASVWTHNCTFETSHSIGTFTPPVPATGVYDIQVQSPSGLSSSINPVSKIQVFYRRPIVSEILPYDTGSIVGTGSFTVVGQYFLSGAQVYFGTSGLTATMSASLSQSVVSTRLIDILTPPYGEGNVFVYVANAEDGQVSVGLPFRFAVPAPTLTDANFLGITNFTKKTGSAGSDLYITGTNFTGSGMPPVTKVSLLSGAFVTATTNFTISSPTQMIYTIPALQTGSHYDLEVSNSAGTATLLNVFEYQDIPVVTSVSPISGTVAGGLFVIVNGRPFYGGSSQVKFDGVLGTAQTVYSVNQMSAITPQATNLDGGQVNVSVQNYGTIEGALSGAFEYVPFPSASYVRSVKGNNRVPAESISTVTLVGTRLMADKVGGRGTTIKLSSEVNPIITSFIDKTQVSFNVQPHAAGFVSLTATNREIAEGAPLVNAIEYVYTPTISSISQQAVPIAGGTTITVIGTNFINSTDTVVFVGTQPAATTVLNSTQLTFVTPALASAVYDVTVVNRSTTVSNVLPLQFIPPPAVTSLSVNQGSSVGGTTVVVNGTGFISGSTTAKFTGTTVNFTVTSKSATLSPGVLSPTQLNFVTPPTYNNIQRGYVDLVISVLGLSTTSSNAFFYEQPPGITLFSPSTALAAGTTTVTMTGFNFVNGVTVLTVDNVVVSYTYVNSALITFVAPAHAIGACTVKVANTFLSASSNGLTYAALAPPIISNIIVGNTTKGVAGDAKWNNTQAGSAHIQGSGYGEELWGLNFTLADVISIIPFDGGATMYPAVSFVDSTKLRFTMPAYANAGQCYVVVANVNGTSNYALGRWNKIPTLTTALPSFGQYNVSTQIALTGSNFLTGETYVGLSNGFQMPATVLNSTTLTFTLPITYNVSTEQAFVQLFVYNSTSMVNEAFATQASIYKTVKPTNVNSVISGQVPTNGSSIQFVTPSSDLYLGQNGPPRLHLFYDWSLIDQGERTRSTAYNTTGTLWIAPAHAAGQVPIWWGYVNEAGAKFIGNGIYLTYFAPPTLVATATGTVSSKSTTYAAGYVGTPTITTAPQISIRPSGGVAPYTTILEFNTANAPYGDPVLPIAYATVDGVTIYANGYGVIPYNDTQAFNSASWRWKVTDSIGTIAYSEYVGVYYNLQPSTGGGGGGGGGGCMVPGTPILMGPDGKTKPIELLNVGDLIWTRPDTGIGPMGYHMVTAVNPTTNLLVKVELVDGRSFTCSINHPLNVRGLWRRADSLQIGEELQGEPTGFIKKLTYLSEGTVIQVTVPSAKTYFAGSGLWQHNLPIQKN